jgi:hypothetical protein
MDQVKVKRLKLLATIKKNRKAHRDLFLKAQEGYRKDMIEELDRMLKDAKDGKQIRRAVIMPEPQDHTPDYDRVIAMLEMSVDTVIELDADSFDNYVMDNWAWRANALATNTMYAAKAGLGRK